MSRNIIVYLNYISDSIRMVKEYTDKLSEDNFLGSRHEQDAVVRRLEVIGEAAKRIPDDIREKFSDIPWRKMSQLRDVLAHDYMEINMKIVWATVKENIIPLETRIDEIIKQYPGLNI